MGLFKKLYVQCLNTWRQQSLAKRNATIAIGCIVLATFGWVAHAVFADVRLKMAVDKIGIGATEDSVLQKLGQPMVVEKCGPFWEPLRVDEPDCKTEYVYRSALFPVLTEYYVIRFDSAGHVKSAAPAVRYASQMRETERKR